jgi:hypothetical protein
MIDRRMAFSSFLRSYDVSCGSSPNALRILCSRSRAACWARRRLHRMLAPEPEIDDRQMSGGDLAQLLRADDVGFEEERVLEERSEVGRFVSDDAGREELSSDVHGEAE